MIIDQLVEALGNIPVELATVVLAMVPIGELRAAIPVAREVWQLSALQAYFYSVIGNMLPFFPLFFGLEGLRSLSEKYLPFFTKFIDKQIERSRGRVEKKYARFGAISLFLFTALPLPMTGLWTATLAAVALKIPFKYAFTGIFLGVLTAGIIVSFFTAAAVTVF